MKNKHGGKRPNQTGRPARDIKKQICWIEAEWSQVKAWADDAGKYSGGLTSERAILNDLFYGNLLLTGIN